MEENYFRLDSSPVDEAVTLIGSALTEIGLSDKSCHDVWASLGKSLSLLNIYKMEKGYVRNDRLGIFRFRGFENDEFGPVRYIYSFEKIHRTMLLLLESYMYLRESAHSCDKHLALAMELVLEACFDKLGKYCAVTFSDIKSLQNPLGRDLDIKTVFGPYEIMYGYKYPWREDSNGEIMLDFDESDRKDKDTVYDDIKKGYEEPPFRQSPETETPVLVPEKALTPNEDTKNLDEASAVTEPEHCSDRAAYLADIENHVKKHKLNISELKQIAQEGYFVKRNDKSYAICPKGLFMKKLGNQKTGARFQYPLSCDTCSCTECIGKNKHLYYYFPNKRFIKHMTSRRQTPTSHCKVKG